MSSEALAALPPLRDVIARHDLAARRSLGQNFLLDLNLTRRIARAAGPLAGVHVYEVGPGPGGLTRALLEEGAEHVTAIDPDFRIPPVMAEIEAAAPGRLTAIEGDALKHGFQPPPGVTARIVANLPYNIATPLLIGWLSAEPWPPWFDRMVLMFQKEVAERIVADPGTKAYGRLAVLAQWKCTADLLFTVDPRAFTPPPKVTSAVVSLTPHAAPDPCDQKMLETVTAAAFGQRRKMLRQSLKSLKVPVEPLLEAAGLDPTARAETIDIAGFVRLTRAYASLSETRA